MDCRLLQEHYEGFALGALEGEERTEIQAHLDRGCPECTAGVEQARGLVAQLAFLAPEAEPPATVRRDLLESVAEPRRRRGWVPVIAWAAAAGLLIAAVLTQQRARELETRLAELEQNYEQLQAENDVYRRVLEIVSAPQTRAVSLSAPASPQIHAYWNEPLGLVLAGRNMPAPAPDRTLQLWIVPKQGNPVSVDIFRPDAAGSTLLISAPTTPIAEAAALAITDEPAGGRPQPTTEPIWVGPLG